MKNKDHPRLIDSFPMIKERTLDWALSNSFPVGFNASDGLKGFPLYAIDRIIIRQLDIRIFYNIIRLHLYLKKSKLFKLTLEFPQS